VPARRNRQPQLHDLAVTECELLEKVGEFIAADVGHAGAYHDPVTVGEHVVAPRSYAFAGYPLSISQGDCLRREFDYSKLAIGLIHSASVVSWPVKRRRFARRMGRSNAALREPNRCSAGVRQPGRRWSSLSRDAVKDENLHSSSSFYLLLIR
jgi:hypothetical protein